MPVCFDHEATIMKGKRDMKKFALAALVLVLMLACCAGVAEETAAALNVGDHFIIVAS